MSLEAIVDKLMQDVRNRVIKVAWASAGLLEIDWDCVASLDTFNPILSGLPIEMPLEHGMPPGVINLKAADINLPANSSVHIEQMVTDKMLAEYIQWTNAPPSSAPTVVGRFPGGPDTYDCWYDVIPGPPPQPPAFQNGALGLSDINSLAEAEQAAKELNGETGGLQKIVDPKFKVHAVTITWPASSTISTETRASYLFNLSKLAALMAVDPVTGLKPPKLTFNIQVPAIASRRDVNSTQYPLARTYLFTFRTYKKTHRDFTTGLGPLLLSSGQVGSTPLWSDGDVKDKQLRSSRLDQIGGIQQGLKAIKWTVEVNLKTLLLTITEEF